MVWQDILDDQLRLLYDDGTQGALGHGGVTSHSKIPISVQSESSVGPTLKQAKMKLDIRNWGIPVSQQYDLYLQRHKASVQKGSDWLETNMPWLFEGRPSAAWQTEFKHNASKSSPDEYEAYDVYFYDGNRSHTIVKAFSQAWLPHIHRDPHHW